MDSTREELKQQVIGQVQGALALNIAYIGIVDELFVTLARLEHASAEQLAKAAGRDTGYVIRWCDSAYAFGLIDEVERGLFTLTDVGDAFRPDAPGTLMPMAIQAVLSAHMAERAAGLMHTGERPGEKVLAERETILPWFGPMLEHSFGPLLEQHILPVVPAFAEVDERGGIAVDLGCGNGWYLRRLVARYPRLRGVGLDGFEENIRQATRLAEAEGTADRLKFDTGDIHRFEIEEPVDLIAMNRALHHVWDQKDNVFRILWDNLRPNGIVVIWEPNWPASRVELRDPGRRAMAFQNLSEHVQGNHFLRPDEIAEQFRGAGFEPEIRLFADKREAVVTGRKP